MTPLKEGVVVLDTDGNIVWFKFPDNTIREVDTETRKIGVFYRGRVLKEGLASTDAEKELIRRAKMVCYERDEGKFNAWIARTAERYDDWIERRRSGYR